jgi:hypothetical protein
VLAKFRNHAYMRHGEDGRKTHNSLPRAKAGGTTTLFAALDILEGKVVVSRGRQALEASH